ncbi:MAG: DinB family protein [bacterium]|nr:DinB family protein [bacterium]
MIEYFRTLARYNRWANRRIYRSCSFLSEEDYLMSRPMFFGSIHACLNHILLVDQLWKARAMGREFQPAGMDQVLYPDLASLKAARSVADEHWLEWLNGVTEAQLTQHIEYHSVTRPDIVGRRLLVELLSHVFNHQTHHRGQVHDQLSGTYAQPPELDMLYFYIDEEQGREG